MIAKAIENNHYPDGEEPLSGIFVLLRSIIVNKMSILHDSV